MQLLLIRHPQPVLDKRYCYGASDIAVLPQQVQACCDALLPQLPVAAAPVPIHSSPLQRCTALAYRLAQALGQPHVLLQEGLREMDFGRWEQRLWDDIPWAEVEAWNQDLLHYAPGGGECLLAVARRMWMALSALLDTQAPQHIVVCHAGTIRIVEACAAWLAEQGGTATRPMPDASALADIALRATAVRSSIAYGELRSLTIR